MLRIDLLVRHVRETLAPSEIAIALFQREAETIDFVLGWPPGRTNPRPLLYLATRRGPLLIKDGLDAYCGGRPYSAPADCGKLVGRTFHRQRKGNRGHRRTR